VLEKNLFILLISLFIVMLIIKPTISVKTKSNFKILDDRLDQNHELSDRELHKMMVEGKWIIYCVLGPE
jgi:hypothetical protein